MIGSIEAKIDYLNKRREEAGVNRAMIQSELEVSDVYQGLKAKIKQCQGEIKRIIHENLHIKKYNDELQEINDELKTLREILDWELFAYSKETNKQTVEDGFGQLYKVTFKSQLKKTNQTELQL